MLNSRLQARVRAAIEARLTQSCTIRRGETQTDDYGRPVEIGVTQIDSACMLTRLRRYANPMVADADVGLVYYSLSLPYDTDIQDGDTVLIGGETYRVEQAERSHGAGVMRQAIVVKTGS